MKPIKIVHSYVYVVPLKKPVYGKQATTQIIGDLSATGLWAKIS